MALFLALYPRKYMDSKEELSTSLLGRFRRASLFVSCTTESARSTILERRLEIVEPPLVRHHEERVYKRHIPNRFHCFRSLPG